MRLAIAILFACLQSNACELLVKAVDWTHPDPVKDRTGAYKRGMIVTVKEDGHKWGLEERLPKFVVIKVPGIPASAALKYIATQTELVNGEQVSYRRRLWQIRWADLPLAARNKLANNGELVIKAGTYQGAADYTWTQVKTYFRNLQTNQDEVNDL